MLTCATCGANCLNLHTHHIVPVALGGTNLKSNLIEICRECHSKIHQKDMTSSGSLVKAGIAKMLKDSELAEEWYDRNKEELYKLMTDIDQCEHENTGYLTLSVYFGYTDKLIFYNSYFNIKPRGANRKYNNSLATIVRRHMHGSENQYNFVS